MVYKDDFEEDYFWDEEDPELNIDEEIELLLEDDEISPEEAGFWHGSESYEE